MTKAPQNQNFFLVIKQHQIVFIHYTMFVNKWLTKFPTSASETVSHEYDQSSSKSEFFLSDRTTPKPTHQCIFAKKNNFAQTWDWHQPWKIDGGLNRPSHLKNIRQKIDQNRLGPTFNSESPHQLQFWTFEIYCAYIFNLFLTDLSELTVQRTTITPSI